MKKILLILSMVVTIQASDLTDGMDAIERGDFKSAVAFFQRAAEAGDKMAQQNLAVMYNNGYGVKKDTEIASQWLNKATDQQSIATIY